MNSMLSTRSFGSHRAAATWSRAPGIGCNRSSRRRSRGCWWSFSGRRLNPIVNRDRRVSFSATEPISSSSRVLCSASLLVVDAGEEQILPACRAVLDAAGLVQELRRLEGALGSKAPYHFWIDDHAGH